MVGGLLVNGGAGWGGAWWNLAWRGMGSVRRRLRLFLLFGGGVQRRARELLVEDLAHLHHLGLRQVVPLAVVHPAAAR